MIVSKSGSYGAGESVSIEILFVNEKIGEQITIFTGDPDKLLRDSQIGDKITVFYDPDNPAQFNNLSGESGSSMRGGWFITGGFLNIVLSAKHLSSR